MNHLYHLLEQYLSNSDNEQWFCATLVSKAGSSYRQQGAMMLVNSLGKNFGMVSGGCLESDVVRRTQRVWQMNQSDYVIYDTEDEYSFASKIGLGCNGKIGVLIQAIEQPHQQLLSLLHQRMKNKQTSYLMQCFQTESENDHDGWILLDQSGETIASTCPSPENLPCVTSLQLDKKHSTVTVKNSHWSINEVSPPIRLWILGGGGDAQPMAEIAANLGWLVTVIDHRVGNARKENFPKAEQILNMHPEEASKLAEFQLTDAFICMNHNKGLDASWMQQLNLIQQPKYVALLGPESRKKEVMSLASASQSFSGEVYGPAGLSSIRSDLPESIALSIISQCHSVLFKQ